MDFWRDPPWLCPPLGWAPWCNPGIEAFSRSPCSGMLTKYVKAPASCSCDWAPVLPATACPSTGGPWGRRLYHSWSSPDVGPGLSYPSHTGLPRLWTNLPSAGDRSWAAWSGIACMGRCPRSSLPGNLSSLGPLAWIVSRTAVSHDPLWPPGLSCPLGGFDGWPISLQAQIAVDQVQILVTTGLRSGNPGACCPQVLTWDWSTPGSHWPCLSAMAACVPGPVCSCCMACRGAVGRPE